MLSYGSPVHVNGQKAIPSDILQQSATITASDIKAAMAESGVSDTTISANGVSQEPTRHVWLVTGPAGCGKSTVAKHISDSLNFPYIEGDEYHTKANVEKMANGIPLTDADRWDWLTLLREESVKRLSEGAEGVVLTCSALKRKYRDVIRVAGYYDPHLVIHFIFLDATEELLLGRVAMRQNHYMGANMVHSQFNDLERPEADETDVIAVDVSGTMDEVKETALARVLEIQKTNQ